MVRKSSRAYYTGISMPKGLMDEVDIFIKKYPELRYKSRADFCKDSLREKMDRDYKLKDRIKDQFKETFTTQELKELKQLLKTSKSKT